MEGPGYSETYQSDVSLRNPLVYTRLSIGSSGRQQIQPAVLPVKAVGQNRLLAPDVNVIVSQLAGQPAVLDQIKNFAKHLGFSNLSGQQVYRIICV